MSSELYEIRRELMQIYQLTANTARDVAWIKEGMEDHQSRMDGHSKRLDTIENGHQRRAGFAAGVSAVFGAAIGVITTKLGIPIKP